MGWSEWPAWVKGGIIIGILLLIADIAFSFWPFYAYVIHPLVGFENYYLGTFTAALFYFLIGALIGFIVGKIRGEQT